MITTLWVVESSRDPVYGFGDNRIRVETVTDVDSFDQATRQDTRAVAVV
jgi:hypothetical protein